MGLIISIEINGSFFCQLSENKSNEPISEQFYGIEFDTEVSDSKATRIGNMEFHRSLPIHSKMRRCVLKDSGEVAYYLNPNNSNLKENGEPAVLDGSDGQVMVEIPSFYYKFEEEGTKRRVMFSEKELPGFKLWKKCYVSAYEATIQRSTNKLSSVVNTSPDYRGGVNDASRDNTFKSSLGKPASEFRLEQARTYARNRGSDNWKCYLYSIHKMLCWLFVVEYATLNSKLDYTAEKVDGFMSGGLGSGVVDDDGSVGWNVFDETPFIDCGVTNKLGNSTAVVNIELPRGEYYPPKLASVPSYRGIENPFGHIFKKLDGVSFKRDGVTVYLSVVEPSEAERSLGYNYPRAEEGYIKEVVFGEYGDIFPKELVMDYGEYFNSGYAGGFVGDALLVGGEANTNAVFAGMFTLMTSGDDSVLETMAGTRLCYIPQ